MICPGCGLVIPAAKFLCNACADTVDDAAMVSIGEAIDAGDRDRAGAEIVAAIAG